MFKNEGPIYLLIQGADAGESDEIIPVTDPLDVFSPPLEKTKFENFSSNAGSAALSWAATSGSSAGSVRPDPVGRNNG